jgi:CheY-like chemotaxis protein/Tfp pilus assembly protein PilZ
MTPKVLLVDDVVMFLDLQKMYLKHSSVRVFTAKDGIQALQIVKKEHPDLIFMDLHMPYMNGADCCALIKEDPQFKSVPIVMVTSEGKESDKDLCQKAGCDDFLTKPIDRVLYLEMARKYLPTINRRNPRVSCREKVKFRVFGLTLTGEVMDISAHGVFIATDDEVEAETMLDLVFALEEENGALIQTRGRVAWVNSKKNKKKHGFPAGFGVELLAITEDSKWILDHFMETQRSKK